MPASFSRLQALTVQYKDQYLLKHHHALCAMNACALLGDIMKRQTMHHPQLMLMPLLSQSEHETVLRYPLGMVVGVDTQAACHCLVAAGAGKKTVWLAVQPLSHGFDKQKASRWPQLSFLGTSEPIRVSPFHLLKPITTVQPTRTAQYCSTNVKGYAAVLWSVPGPCSFRHICYGCWCTTHRQASRHCSHTERQCTVNTML